MPWEERGSCLNIFRTIDRGRISETFTNYEAKDLLRKTWEERGSCLNIFWTTNRGRISEKFMNYEAKYLLRNLGRSVDHVLTYSRRSIASGFDAGLGFVKAWEERGSCLKIF
ncbi:uncharacterized protein G2W53_021951 [Senna tora]|uniref:Uncharacterized protein n=1 Tax=Senna tora TaxID=362788 RepID=A0A834WIC2_9FABA|nr:uncharacterized protein G2W53_021951 [Senna tora]